MFDFDTVAGRVVITLHVGVLQTKARFNKGLIGEVNTVTNIAADAEGVIVIFTVHISGCSVRGQAAVTSQTVHEETGVKHAGCIERNGVSVRVCIAVMHISVAIHVGEGGTNNPITHSSIRTNLNSCGL